MSLFLSGSAFLFTANSFGAAVFAGFLGGVVTGGLEGGLWGAFSAGLFRGIGNHFTKLAGANTSGVLTGAQRAQKVLAHA